MAIIQRFKSGREIVIVFPTDADIQRSFCMYNIWALQVFLIINKNSFLGALGIIENFE